MTITEEMFAAAMSAAQSLGKHTTLLPTQTKLSHYQKLIEQERIAQQEVMKQQRIAQQEQDFELRLRQQQKEKEEEEQRLRKQQQLDYIECLTARKNRIERDFKFLRIFSELETFRAVLEQERQAQAYFDEQSLDDVEILTHELHEANKRESLNLFLMRGKAERLWQERQRQIERLRLANQKRQDEEKRRKLQEEEKRREQERLKAEQEQYARKRERIEQNRLIQQRLHQEQKAHQLKLRQQQRQKFQQELLQKEYGLLLTLEEVKSCLRGLKAFYPPRHNGYDAFIQQIELLTIDCHRHLNNSFQQSDKRTWANMLAELKTLKTICLELAETKDWFRSEEDEAWKHL